MFPFEKLDIWQKAIEFAGKVYQITRTFPNNERFGLTSQMRRAAVSIGSNIAEGSSRYSRDDFARFLEIATGSLYEVIAQAKISLRQGMLPDSEYKELYEMAETQSRMLSGLRRSINNPS